MLNQRVMSEKSRCPRCDAEIPSDSLEGLCPRCLGALNLDPETEVSGAENTSSWTAPPITELSRLFPQLELLDFIGRGGMGAVYKARQRELDRLVALKILPPGIGRDPAFAERFTREAKALAKLSHPGIVTIHDFGRTNGLYFLVMEFVDGVNLRQLLGSDRVSPREALAIVPEICDALQYAHDQGIVHRDIKPENILLDRRGRVKVADFGLAKIIAADSDPVNQALSTCEGDESKTPATLTSGTKILGTPAYMAPEQVNHPNQVDHRADIYALGVVFYQMLTGGLPDQPFDVPSKKVRIDIRLDEVVMRALEKEPQRRYQQISQIKSAVDTIAQTTAPAESKVVHKRKLMNSSERTMVRAAKWSKLSYIGVPAGLVALLAIWFCVRLFSGWLATFEADQAGARKPFFAAVVHKGDRAVSLDSLGNLEASNSVAFAIPEKDCQEVLRRFNAHQPLAVDAYDPTSGKIFGHGFLTGTDNQIDTSTGTLKCRAHLIPEDEALPLPGKFLEIRMLLDHTVLWVPFSALVRDSQSTFTWVVQSDNKVTRRPIRVGTVEGKWAEVQAGLSPGEIVVSDRANYLHEGQKLEKLDIRLQTIDATQESDGP
jgi:serine/threonine protein kinase